LAPPRASRTFDKEHVPHPGGLDSRRLALSPELGELRGYLAKRLCDLYARVAAQGGDVEAIHETADTYPELGLQEIVDHYAQLIEALDQPPVTVGHSYGVRSSSCSSTVTSDGLGWR
jgi:hypothetical protein